MILAIDPGAQGGLAWHSSYGIQAMPMCATPGDIITVLRDLEKAEASHTYPRQPLPSVAYVEQLVKHMGVGIPASTMAVYASNWGIVVGALMMANWRVVMVTPQQWQKALGLGVTGRLKAKVTDLSEEAAKAEKKRVRIHNQQLKREFKNRLKQKAQELYPGVEVTLLTSDALLILRYGQLQERGAA